MDKEPQQLLPKSKSRPNDNANEQAVVLYDFKKPLGIKPSKKKKVLSEDDFSDGISKIIERDFFPDIPKMKVQEEYRRALETNDLVKLREIETKFIKRPDTDVSALNTPATFETPEQRKATPAGKSEEKTAKINDQPKTVDEALETWDGSDPEAPKQKLDSFLAKNTSEDSASFAEILEASENKRIMKNAWVYNKEKEQLSEHDDMLALPSIEQQAMIEDRPTKLNTWKYVNHNTVMYVPEGEELSAKELIEEQKHKPKEIVHENTRFQTIPFSTTNSKVAMQKAASFKASINLGKIGHDGKEVQPLQSPQVNGYGFVGTPSPAPGVMDSPMMTWGEIDSTPARIESDYLSTPGPKFKIPELPKRDQLALELTEKASKAHRAKKEEAIRQVTRRFASPSPISKIGLTSQDRLSSMSPAAQKLASSRLKIRTASDKALQASYSPSPSPSYRQPGSKTPVRLTPGSKRSLRSLPGSPAITPDISASPATSKTPSLTDHLLNLPKRQRKTAADFF